MRSNYTANTNAAITICVVSVCGLIATATCQADDLTGVFPVEPANRVVSQIRETVAVGAPEAGQDPVVERHYRWLPQPGCVLVEALLRSRRKIFVFIAALLTIVVIFGALMYVVEGPENGFSSIPAGMYWAIVTVGTVGFGDIAPTTPFGRFVTSVLIVIGYSIIAVPTGIYTAELARSLQPRRRRVRCAECGLPDHEADAWHCRKCGRALPPEQ